MNSGIQGLGFRDNRESWGIDPVQGLYRDRFETGALRFFRGRKAPL